MNIQRLIQFYNSSKNKDVQTVVPLTFTAYEVNSSVKLSVFQGTPNDIELQYSTDNCSTWNDYTIDQVINLTSGNSVSFKGLTTVFNKCEINGKNKNSYHFVMTGKIVASGNVMSLINYKQMTQVGTFLSLFQGCTSLISSPQLPSLNISIYGYSRMFYGCSGLLYAPQLPAETVADCAYARMFVSCTSLTETPIIYGKILKQYCYYYMFSGCTSLRRTCILHCDSKIDYQNFYYMFNGCKKLDEIAVQFTQWNDEKNITTNWVNNVASSGTFYCNNSLPLNYGVNAIPSNWQIKTIQQYNELYFTPLTFTCTENTGTIGIEKVGNPCKVDIRYKVNDDIWRKYVFGKTIALNANDTVQFINKNDEFNDLYQYNATLTNYYLFETNGNFKLNVSGNINSLINFKNISFKSKFSSLFSSCNNIYNVNNLKLKNYTSSNSCYSGMFSGCTNLTTSPSLPATTLADSCYSGMFSGCTNLTTSPSLPATTLASYCYSQMFSKCTSLTASPSILPATTLASYCYQNMFQNCTSLTTSPQLPATTLASYCYSQMFSKCTSLTTVPSILPATTLASYCYSQMFSKCTSLTTSPQLPATTLASYCYQNMFNNCTRLTTAPSILPATTLASYCYSHMFIGCTSLTKAPQILATTLTTDCCSSMFTFCTSLNYILCHFTSFGNETSMWMNGVSNTGTFINDNLLNTDDLLRNVSTILQNWQIITQQNTFNLVADAANSTVTLNKVGSPDDISLQYLTKNQYWQDYTVGNTITLSNVGDFVYLRAKQIANKTSYTFSKGNSTNYYQFAMTGTIKANGQVNSLINNSALTNYCYANLFLNCNSLISAPKLSSTTLANYCYYRMFRSTSIVNSPELTATTLASYCYFQMFSGNSKLLTAPVLSVTDLSNYSNCYYGMFSGCSKLTAAPQLPATQLSYQCYAFMFESCKALTEAPSLPATTLKTGCYQYMFYQCIGLTTFPKLNATTLVTNCYKYMFYGCTNLNLIITYFTTDWTNNTAYTDHWVSGVASSGKFFKVDSLPEVRGISYIPENWTVENADLVLLNSTVNNYTVTNNQLTINNDDTTNYNNGLLIIQD